jgi:ADP-heptose:LPS heptosyltransferase
VVVSDERMGELLLAGPLIRGLASILPASEVHLLHADRFSWLARSLPGVKKTVPFQKRAAFKTPLDYIRRLLALRREGYDLAVDGGKDDEISLITALLMRICGAPVRLTHKRGLNPLATLAVPRYPEATGEAARRLSLLCAFTRDSFDPLPRLKTGKTHATALSFSSGLPKLKAGIYPGSRKPDHRIDPGVLAGAARLLAERGFDVSIVPGLGETALCNGIASASGARVAPVLEGEALMAMISGLDLFISNNTGPMHLSVALGVPTLGLFIKADPERWGHSRPPHCVLDLRDKTPKPLDIIDEVAKMTGPPV